ncbi:hypothetical protein N7466_010701 [Penicillium verhagenii]|uniref:uncharacterized protein n=1 Tax=Penicillium verhagenii TaxID=1562060 RepID=UPI0025457284|nr:uncharacterized protein N7466_010701 [Penicillium verhagenii]KAJ5917147.1 hypothetical protein N7466_010701 [Penicillium verhagenii]
MDTLRRTFSTAGSTRHGNTQPENGTGEMSESSSNGDERVQFSGDGLNTGVKVLGDGRLDIKIHEHRPKVADLLNRMQRSPLISQRTSEMDLSEDRDSREGVPDKGQPFPLKLNIVIQVIGSRGDIQPFIALGKGFKEHGHRVRLATHLAFRDPVLEAGLEFFNIGGDPAELMAFMVKNPGLLPNFSTIRSGAIQKRRREMNQIINGCWKSCFQTGDGTDLHQIKEDPWSDTVDWRQRPFVADAIIANPPSLAHIHCAQRLGIPLHIMFTMPWSPTQSFPHPLAVLHPQQCKPTVANFVSYAVVDMMVWEGLGDLVNKLRKKILSLDPLDSITAPSLIHRLQIPCTYLWSPALLSKPRDWSDNIDICGFSFLPSESNYQPPREIQDFLDAGPVPIYVGFGSIVVDDPIKLTKIVFGAIEQTGQRALVSKGWGNLGAEDVEVPDNILIIGSCPHDWLFRHVSCVIHHGGAGTTAAGLALGRPTIVVPFFGDQEFWGGIVARAGAGPQPIPHKQLTVDSLSSAIEMALKPSTHEKAQDIENKMKMESGVKDAVRSFHQHLDLESMRCAICTDRPAAWHIRHTKVGLTGPLSASAQVLFGAISNFVIGLADVPVGFIGDLFSAGRMINHPHDHTNPIQVYHCRRAHRQSRARSRSRSRSRSLSRELSTRYSEAEEGSEGDNERTPEHFQREAVLADTEEEDSGEEQSDDNVSIFDDEQEHASSSVSSETLGRQMSLQLEKQVTMGCEMRAGKHTGIVTEAAIHWSILSKRLLNLLIWIPTDVSLSLSKGFHNAPRLYNDQTVTDTPKVHSFRSGFRAAGKEFTDSFYHGITGLVTHPRRGFKENGAKGMMKGVGKGLGGIVFKPPAGLWGLAGYPLTGIRRTLLVSLGKSQQNHIVVSRIAQGHEEMPKSSEEERSEVIRKWILLEEELRKGKRYIRRSSKRQSEHDLPAAPAPTAPTAPTVPAPRSVPEIRIN